MNISRQKQRNMILNDNLWSVMIKLSAPAIVAMLLYGLNTIFDAIFVGKFVGEVALSGVSLAYPLTQIALGIGSMIGGGAGAFLSIAIGKDDKEEQSKVLGNTHYLILFTTIIYVVLALIFSRSLIALMGGSGEALELGVAYFRITVIGSLFWISGLAYNLIIRAEGKMGQAAVIMGFGLIVNIVINYILMGIFDFGVVGAAWGTNIGMGVYTLSSILYFNSKAPSFETNLFSIRYDKEVIKEMLSMGMPSFIMTIMTVIQGAIILSTVSSIGTDYDIAFYGVVFRIYNFMLTPLFATMRSLQPTVGINFGAKQYNRVIDTMKVYILGSSILLLPFYIILMVNPNLVLSLMFTSPIKAADLFNCRIFLAIIPFLSITLLSMAFFPSIKRGKIGSNIAMLRQVALYIPGMIILPRLFGISWVYIGSFVIDVAVTLLLVFLLFREFKRLKTISIA